jgi:phosphoribosylaminoimidazole (AIR) synthetase
MTYKIAFSDIDELCEYQIEERSGQLWRSFAGMYANTSEKLTPEHIDEMKQAVRDYLPQILREIEEPLTTRAMVSGKGWNDLVQRVLRKVDAEIEEVCIAA